MLTFGHPIELLIFGFCVILTGYWTIDWCLYFEKSRVHFWLIVEVIVMGTTIIYFYTHPYISKYHLIWVFPLAYIGGFFMAGIPLKYYRNKNDETISREHEEDVSEHLKD